MNGDDSVRDKTREAVLAAARELNYKKTGWQARWYRQKSVKIAIVYSKVSKGLFSGGTGRFSATLRKNTCGFWAFH